MHMKQRFGYSVHAKHSCSFSQSKLLPFPNLGRATTNATAAKTSVKKSAPRCFFYSMSFSLSNVNESFWS